MGSYSTNISDIDKSEYGPYQEFTTPVITKHSLPGCIEGLENMYECLHTSSTSFKMYLSKGCPSCE